MKLNYITTDIELTRTSMHSVLSFLRFAFVGYISICILIIHK